MVSVAERRPSTLNVAGSQAPPPPQGKVEQPSASLGSLAPDWHQSGNGHRNTPIPGDFSFRRHCRHCRRALRGARVPRGQRVADWSVGTARGRRLGMPDQTLGPVAAPWSRGNPARSTSTPTTPWPLTVNGRTNSPTRQSGFAGVPRPTRKPAFEGSWEWFIHTHTQFLCVFFLFLLFCMFE
jgi:hypothetical protein